MSFWLKQSTQIIARFGPFLDKTDGVVEEVGLAGNGTEISKNHAAFGTGPTLGTHDADGWYPITLTTTHTDTLGPLTVKSHDSAVHLPVWLEFLVVPANIWDSFFSTDFLQVDVTQLLGTAWATPATAGLADVNVKQISTDGPAADNAEAFFDGTGYAGTGNVIPTVTAVTTVNGLAANVITAASIAADAAPELRGALISGTADSGTTTTMVDAALTEGDTDYWKGNFILFTSGTISGQCRLITGFTPGTDTVTFAPTTTQAVGTNTYEILAFGRVDVQNWLGSVVNALIAGRVDASVGALATGAIVAGSFGAGAIDAAAIATGAIDADAIAADAITAAKIANGAIDAATFAAGAIDAAAIANAAIDAATFAAGALDAAALATDAVNEIRDAVWAQAMTELGAVPGVTGTLKNALEFLFLLSRNKITQTATTQLLRNDADSATIATSTLSDDGSIFTRGEFA
jgi:hypothetical protein